MGDVLAQKAEQQTIQSVPEEPGVGTTTRVSVASDGSEAYEWSRYSSISADGRYVAFSSDASNLVLGDTNQKMDVFVRDREGYSMYLPLTQNQP